MKIVYFLRKVLNVFLSKIIIMLMEDLSKLQEADFSFFFNVLLDILICFFVLLWMELLSRHAEGYVC